MEGSPVFSSGIENAESDSIGHLADVKVEEVDLDSASDDDEDVMGETGTFQFREVKDIVSAGDKRGQQGGEDNSNQPSLTLQSFARIPALATQDIIPPFVQNLTQDLAVPNNHERQLPQEMSSK